MQVPSCTNVRIRSTADVHKIFYAVYLGLLPMITRRLDAKEREALSSGYCYAWEDRGPHAITGIGIERFTEGRHWSASRVRDEFLFYYEKWEPPKSKNSERASDTQPARDWDPFVKQTYSVYLSENEGSKRKWHLTAYFTQATVDSLGTVDDIPVLKDLVVPDGLFKSSRRTKTRSSRANTTTHAPEGTPDLSAQVSSSGRTGGQIAPVADPSSTQNRPALQVAAQQSTSQQNQGLPPPSPYPQDLFNAQSPDYPGLPVNPAPPAQHDAYTRIYGDSYTPSPQAPEGFHIPPAPQMQPHGSLGYNWPAVPVSPSDNTCQSPYPYPMLVASQNMDSTFHSSPAQSQVYVYGSTSQASPSSLYHHYRTVSPALSHAPSQFSTSSQSQSSSESDSPAPRPVSVRTPFFSPEPLPGQLPNDGETKFEAVTLEGIQEHDGPLDVGLAPLSKLKRFHPYRRDPLDDLFVQSLGSRPV
ncbi:hypothetical protein EDB89DRAFT_103028 [Lactarius sanguifluus]|nr:hypothetical protein EDB89DRAFT_103028 [Lactarius sanguifluus]